MLTVGCILFVPLFAVVAAEHCERNDGRRQSPVNINPLDALPSFASSFKWSQGYFDIPEEITLVDNGETIKLSANISSPAILSGGRLPVPYAFKQLHFHWGSKDEMGSEHRISGIAYPLEMHVVHTQSLSNDTDEYVVVSYFFRLSIVDNKGLRNLLDAAIAATDNRNTTIYVKPFALADLIATTPFSYYTYEGSLTTAPYTESVNWIIASSALPVSSSQLAILRRVAKLDPELSNNFRCLQDLNGRRIDYIHPYTIF